MDRTGYLKLYSTSDLKQSVYMASADPLLQGKLAAELIKEKDLGFRTWETARGGLNTSCGFFT
ncbi:hypothetical protein F2Q69_00030436 [Brassica cretica]|uniref:Uncharacterized protein n=1 Tax=Brassica cretica TaxID=69181 RepID=A0A8S9SAE7_BRACR|nr:hypothetical protein F2Q69_00030436 [Brassica cretica]